VQSIEMGYDGMIEVSVDEVRSVYCCPNAVEALRVRVVVCAVKWT